MKDSHVLAIVLEYSKLFNKLKTSQSLSECSKAIDHC